MKFVKILSAAVLAAAVATPALAQDNVLTRATYLVSVTDPDSGNIAYVTRNSIRSWETAGDCETQRKTFSGYNLEVVEGFHLKTKDGKPHTVKMVSITCHPEGKK